jgi:CRP-like cAMP-binding protein
MVQPQYAYRNQIIGALTPEDFDAMRSHLAPVRLDLRLDLEIANEPIRRVCFPESGIISVVAKSEGLGTIEVGLVGHEGMTGVPVIMGDTRWPQNTYVQVPVAGHWLEAAALRTLLDASPAMREMMVSYALVFAIQIAQTALANGRAKIDARLARWILMAADRLEDPEMPLTHELLALMLGVRRPGVTDSLHRLEGEHMVKARRGFIAIRDRTALEALAGGSYGVPEREYRRVMGQGASPPETPVMIAVPA